MSKASHESPFSLLRPTSLTALPAACVTKHKHRSRRRLSFLKRVAVLVKRSFRQNFRDTAVNGLRLGACGILSFVFSAIFGENLKGEPTAKSVADRTALLSYAVINMAMMSLMKTLDLFGKEKPVVMRERMRGHYGGTEYIVAKVIAEVPLDASFSIVFATLLKKYTNLNVPTTRLAATLGMTTICTDLLGFAVGSVCSTGDAALAVGTPLMIIYMVLGIINPAGATKNGNDSLPWFLKLLKYASPIRWAIESLCCAEFRGLKLSRKGRPSMGGKKRSDEGKVCTLLDGSWDGVQFVIHVPLTPSIITVPRPSQPWHWSIREIKFWKRSDLGIRSGVVGLKN